MERRLKHWGWGYEDQAPTATQLREAAEGIRARFGFGGEMEKPVPLEEVELRESRLKRPEAFGDLFSDGRYERVSHALGKAYRDVVRGFYGKFENPPDLVASPRDESEIEAVLSWAEAEGAAVVPFGGGTSVVGGVEPRLGERPVVSLDLRRLDRVLEVDAQSLAARIQAGATGPGLEDQLREHGLTLRHFPQSFEYATLGGWIATRAGGHFATLETHIDDLVESVRAITPRGTWESRRLPGSGAGPSPDRMLIGSEGILGVIAEAWVRVRPRPQFKASVGVTFEDFGAAVAAAARSPSPACIPPTAVSSTPTRPVSPAPVTVRVTSCSSASSPPGYP
jgi:alkyldihydroxyacetonephosphate synthase